MSHISTTSIPQQATKMSRKEKKLFIQKTRRKAAAKSREKKSVSGGNFIYKDFLTRYRENTTKATATTAQKKESNVNCIYEKHVLNLYLLLTRSVHNFSLQQLREEARKKNFSPLIHSINRSYKQF